MTASIVTYEGAQDGIRFGWIHFGQSKRAFQFDRINRSLKLFVGRNGGDEVVHLDTDPRRLAEATAAILAREPLP